MSREPITPGLALTLLWFSSRFSSVVYLTLCPCRQVAAALPGPVWDVFFLSPWAVVDGFSGCP